MQRTLGCDGLQVAHVALVANGRRHHHSGGVTAAPNTFVSQYAWTNGAVGSALLLTAIISGFPILVGVFLIYFPGTIANRVVSAGEETAGTLLPLQQVAFSVLGLYFATYAVIEAAWWIAFLLIIRPGMSAVDYYMRLASIAAAFVAGVLLLFGGRGLANFVHRLRNPSELD